MWDVSYDELRLILSQHLPCSLLLLLLFAVDRLPVPLPATCLAALNSTPLRLVQTRVDKTTACRLVGVKNRACVYEIH